MNTRVFIRTDIFNMIKLELCNLTIICSCCKISKYEMKFNLLSRNAIEKALSDHKRLRNFLEVGKKTANFLFYSCN